MHDITDESDETLSLCDLPLYSDHQSVEEWQQDISAQSLGSSSNSSSGYFEFSRHELSPSTADFPPESIIFCGKHIPYEKPQDTSVEDSIKLVETKRPTNIKKKRGWGIFRRIFRLSRNNHHEGTILKHKDQSAKKKYNSSKEGKRYDYPVHKMSLLSYGKGRWYSFGVSRFSSEVQWKDIKSRLSRRQRCPSPPPSPATLNNGSGLTGLIRVLSCGGNHHPNTMVVASTS